jgi:hypothetical protein
VAFSTAAEEAAAAAVTRVPLLAWTGVATGDTAAEVGGNVDTSSTAFTPPFTGRSACNVDPCVSAHEPIPHGACGSSTLVTGMHAQGYSTRGLFQPGNATGSETGDSTTYGSTHAPSTCMHAGACIDPPNVTLRKHEPTGALRNVQLNRAPPGLRVNVSPSQRRCLDSISINHTHSNVTTAALPAPDLLPSFVERWESLSIPPTQKAGADTAPVSPVGSLANTVNTYNTYETMEATGSTHTPSYLLPTLQRRGPRGGGSWPSDEPRTCFDNTYVPPPFVGDSLKEMNLQQEIVSGTQGTQSPKSSPKKRISGFARSISIASLAAGAIYLIFAACHAQYRC